MVILIIILIMIWLVPYHEGFQDIKMPENMPEPQQIIKVLRNLLDQYDKPEMWAHAKRVNKMNPGELARLEL